MGSESSLKRILFGFKQEEAGVQLCWDFLTEKKEKKALDDEIELLEWILGEEIDTYDHRKITTSFQEFSMNRGTMLLKYANLNGPLFIESYKELHPVYKTVLEEYYDHLIDRRMEMRQKKQYEV